MSSFLQVGNCFAEAHFYDVDSPVSIEFVFTFNAGRITKQVTHQMMLCSSIMLPFLEIGGQCLEMTIIFTNLLFERLQSIYTNTCIFMVIMSIIISFSLRLQILIVIAHLKYNCCGLPSIF